MIQIIKHGVILREFPLEEYALSLVNGMVVILEKFTNKPVAVFSPNFYDLVEVDYEHPSDAQ